MLQFSFKTQGEKSINPIPSYIYKNQKSVAHKEIIAKHSGIKIKTSEKHNTSKNVSNINHASAAKYNQLLSLLHEAIANQQSIPDDLTKTATTTVSFMLNPDGRLENVNLKKGSGLATLDNAALQSVQAINPFVMAKNFIKIPTDFTIDIVYES